MEGHDGNDTVGNPSVRLCEIIQDADSCGFNVTKTKWDPYPWVSSVEEGSPAALAGVEPGDCLLEVNGEDMLGLRVAQVAARIRIRAPRATVMLWNPGCDTATDSETLCCGPMPGNLQRLAKCMASIVEALECPVCLETTSPPAHQCVNGHIICLKCRSHTDKCPVCRVRIFRGRSLLSDQVFEAMIDAFNLRQAKEATRAKLLTQKVCGTAKRNKKPEVKISFLTPTKKFAKKFLGKSSSVENLSDLKDGDYNGGLMIKSQSSSEICKVGTLGGSRLSSRPGSGLLTSGGSALELRRGVMADLDVDVKEASAFSTKCLLAPSCSAQLPIGQLKNHLLVTHKLSLFYSCQSKLELNKSLLTNTIVVLECFNTVFFVRLESIQALPKLWVWTVDETTAQYSASITIRSSTSHCDVIPLFGQQISEAELSQCGLPLENLEENTSCLLELHQSHACDKR